MRKDPDQSRAQSSELILLDQLVQVDAQKLENQAEVLAMDKCVSETEQMVVVILVELAVEQIQHRHLHHTLIEVGSAVLDNLDGNDFLCLQILTLDHLSEGTLTKHIENEVPVPERYTRSASAREPHTDTEGPSYLWPVSSEPKMSFT